MRFSKPLAKVQPLLLLLALSTLSCQQEISHPVSQPVPPSAQSTPNRFSPDFKPDFLRDGRPYMSFVALDNPQTVVAGDAGFMNPNEYVVGIQEGKESRAYPVRFLRFHHVINDTIGSPPKPVAITYCDMCNVGIRYDPVVDGKTLKFDFFGVYNGVATLCERQTEGVFLIEEGRIVSGPLADTHLNSDSSLDTTWTEWKRLHPNTRVMAPQPEFASHYDPSTQYMKRGEARFPNQVFESSITHKDSRLPLFTMVLAITLPNSHNAALPWRRAYPLKALQHAGDVVNEMWENTPVAVMFDVRSQTAAAFSRRLGKRTLTLEARKQSGGEISFYDRETGTSWNLEGCGEAGALAGKRLERLNNHLSQWYGWVASFPDTSIYGCGDLPKTKNSVL